jgi:hypothetical protein
VVRDLLIAETLFHASFSHQGKALAVPHRLVKELGFYGQFSVVRAARLNRLLKNFVVSRYVSGHDFSRAVR